MIEQSEIQFGLTRVPFLIRRSDRRSTVALTIDDGGKLVVTAPTYTTVDRLNAVVRTKAPWVIRGMRRASDRPPPPSEREFVTGETVRHLGRQFRLKVIERDDADEPRIWAGWYEVPIPLGLVGTARRREIRRRLLGSLKEHADISLPGRLGDVCHRLRIEKPSLIVREQQKRWGSCDSRGVLRINWRIIQAPTALIEYVLVHELAHLTHPKHGPDFWRLVERWMPDYETRKRRLKDLGPTLVW